MLGPGRAKTAMDGWFKTGPKNLTGSDVLALGDDPCDGRLLPMQFSYRHPDLAEKEKERLKLSAQEAAALVERRQIVREIPIYLQRKNKAMMMRGRNGIAPLVVENSLPGNCCINIEVRCSTISFDDYVCTGLPP
jgi:hypothetical protein